MSDHNFIKEYIRDFSEILKPSDDVIEQLILVRDKLLNAKNNNKKIIIFGNGGSAAIASHVSVDMSKNAKLRCLNFNEADLITCLSNDYGFEHWPEKAIEIYGDEGDVLIVISSSGNSANMLNAVIAAREGNFSSVITLSGFSENNAIHKKGDVNLWVDSCAYNFVENIHQLWLLSIVDLIVGKKEYLPT